MLIVFLDAASDSNFRELKTTFLEPSNTDSIKKEMLVFEDGDANTALHFGAKNGNVRIC